MDYKKELNNLMPNYPTAVDSIASILDIIKSKLDDDTRPTILLFMDGNSQEYLKMLKAMSKVANIPPSDFMAGTMAQKRAQISMLPMLDSPKFAHKIVVITDDTFTDSDIYLLDSAKEGNYPLQSSLAYIEKHKGKYIPEILNRVSQYILFS